MSKLLENIEKNYVLEKEVGRGGMGVVYSAVDKRLDRKVAIKILSLSNFSNDKSLLDEILSRFKREAKSIAKLSHTNIVNLYDIGESEDSYYMVMEFLEGKPLSTIIQEYGKISSSLVANIGFQVCNAISYAHENSVIHRDIKPANIILSPKGLVKLTDFGIAQLGNEQIKLTQAGSVLGSILYIPPEQLENSANVDLRADIYSLGITLYELSTGVIPFNSDSVSDVFMKILKETPKSPRELNSEIPDSLDFIIMKALSKDPSDRYQSAKEMANALSNLIDPSLVVKDRIINIFSNDYVEYSKESSTGTLIISNTTLLRKTSINKDLISTLENKFSWIVSLFKDCRTEVVTKLDVKQLLLKLIDTPILGNGFSGALIVDKSIYIFIYNSHILGAIDIKTGLSGDSIFKSLSKNNSLLELKITDKDLNSFIPVVVSSIIDKSSDLIHTNLDSSLVNLVPLVDSIYNDKTFTGYVTCFSEKDIFYSAFNNGEEVFCISVNNSDNNSFKLKDIIINNSVIFNAYSVKPKLALPSILNILRTSQVNIKYKNENESKLYDISDMEDKEVPIHIIKECKNNIDISLKISNEEKIKIFNYDIDPYSSLTNTIYLNFINWFFKEYFYLINSTSNINSFKYIYSWIPAVEHIEFCKSLKGDDDNNYEFSIVFNGQVKGENYKKVLFLVRFGNGEKSDVEKFLDDSIKIKKKLIKSGDIGSIIYVSEKEFENNSLKFFYERTVEPRKGFGLGSLDKLTKYKGFVRIGIGRGFHFNLIEYNQLSSSFDVIAPLLK